jgi:hypothetical protein
MKLEDFMSSFEDFGKKKSSLSDEFEVFTLYLADFDRFTLILTDFFQNRWESARIYRNLCIIFYWDVCISDLREKVYSRVIVFIESYNWKL